MSKKMKYGLSLISLIITVIVIIILASIVLFSGLETPDRANFAKFVEEFLSYKAAIGEDYIKKKTAYALTDATRTNEQIIYMIATGNENGVDMNTEPVASGFINDLTIEIFPEKLSGTKYFEIAEDSNIEKNNKKKTFYDSFEKHYITDTGEVFILPGYLVEENGLNRWYISENKYYVSSSKIEAGSKLAISNIYSIGNYVDYSPIEKEYSPAEEITGTMNQSLKTDIDAKWRILFVDNENDEIYITPGIVNNSEKFVLFGTLGYFNSINELNNICNTLYSNEDKGILARSLNIKDMNKICNHKEIINSGYKYFLKATEYGENTEEKVDGVTYIFSQASMKKRFFTGVGGNTKSYEGIPYQSPVDGNPVYVKNTSYSYNYSNMLIKEILNNQSSIGWLASNCATTKSGYVEYGTFALNNEGVNYNYLMTSSGWQETIERWNNTSYSDKNK